MANKTYDVEWEEAMGELNEQIHIEDHTMGIQEGEEGPPAPPQANILEAFQHYSCLYIKYVQIYNRLEECYDKMIHPQKRIDVKQVLEVVMARVVELKHDLVRWNPPNPSIQMKPERNFPWEYVNLDDILVDLKLPPETLEVSVPRYFKEDETNDMRKRDRMVKGYMKLKLGVDEVFLGKSQDDHRFTDVLSLDEAIQIIQRNERGRAGKNRAALVKEIRQEETQRKMYDISGGAEMDPEIAACHIQRLYRGYHSRHVAVSERDRELIFIGMKPHRRNTREMAKKLERADIVRKAKQLENSEGYTHALLDLKAVVKDDEGPLMREVMLDERRAYIQGAMELGTIPGDLIDFYASKNPVVEEAASEEGGTKGGKKEKKGEKKSTDKKTKGEKGKKKKNDVAEEGPEVPPQLTGPSALTATMLMAVDSYEQVWMDRDESNNFGQRHDVDLAKDVVRGPVETEIRTQVDDTLKLQLINIKAQLEAASTSSKKGKKGKKGGGKKGKKGGKKKGGKKAKGGKAKAGKKGKALPGDKIAELKGRSTETMLSYLVENRMVCLPTPADVQDLIGDFNYLGAVNQSAEVEVGKWTPQNPSAPQLRQSITEYAILPLGSPFVRARTPNIRSIMFYGSSGSGKTMMANAVAHATGALLLDLSANNLQGKFMEKLGVTKLVHMVFAIAKDPAMQPVIIYMDDCETIFSSGGGKKKGTSSDGPSRFRKDLVTYVASLSPTDRVLILGCTKNPELADLKETKSFFDKFLYFPFPEYSSRLMLWKRMISKAIEERADVLEMTGIWNLIDHLDLGSLACISEGYASGSICRAVDDVLTLRRVERMDKRPLQINEFISPLARTTKTYLDDYEKCLAFTKTISGLEKRVHVIQETLEAAKGDGDEKKKGKKGK